MHSACDISHAVRDRREPAFTETPRTRHGLQRFMGTTDTNTDAIWAALGTVIDPELGLDIVTLGLVYAVERDGDTARVTHTLTTPGCPMERIITDGIRTASAQVEGIARVETTIVWDPAWHPGMIAPGAFPG